jgi:hypothetical protein
MMKNSVFEQVRVTREGQLQMNDSDVAGAFDGLTQAQKSLAVQSAGMDAAQAERMVRDEPDRHATVQTGYVTTIKILGHKAGRMHYP